jgi:hypothetical protein
MRLSHARLTAAAGATAAVLAASPSALAADAVYGGSSPGGDPIVVKADPKATELRSVAISWRAVCDDGSGFPGSTLLTPVKPVPGFSPGPDELIVSRNAKGRFQGVQLTGATNGADVAAVQVEVAGRLKGARASGTLSAIVKIRDEAGASLGSCQASQRWTATRAAGLIYGGTTSQGQPFVARLDAKRKRVNDVLTTWVAPCREGYFRVPDHWGNFAVKRTGSFGNPFTDDVSLDGGAKRHFDYRFAGKLSRTSAKGTLQVKIADTDASGAATDSCDTGGVTWKAATG